jgi:hypothetical protein
MTEVVSQRPVPAWKRGALEHPEDVRKVLAIFNKISPATANGFISQILSINVLENPDEETPELQDSSRMKPIIDAIVAKYKENDLTTSIKVYSHITASLMSEWRGRQKNVFKRLMLETIENHFKSYLASELFEDHVQKEERQVIPCVNLLSMLFTVSTYKNENIIPIHIAFKGLYMFIGPELNKLEVFNRGLFRCYDLMKNHPLFEKFFKRLIIDNLEKVSTSESVSNKLRFECKDLILYVESGKLSPVLREKMADLESNKIVL